MIVLCSDPKFLVLFNFVTVIVGCESLSNYDEEKSNSVISARRIRDERSVIIIAKTLLVR